MKTPNKRTLDAYNTYAAVDISRMELRDHLAADRTKLANQRTFLAYVRTSLTVFVVGVTFIQFFGSSPVEVIGWVFIPIGVVTFAVGYYRYTRLRIALGKIGRPRDLSGD